MNENVQKLVQKHETQLEQNRLELNSINQTINQFHRLIQDLSDKFSKLDALRDLPDKFDAALVSFTEKHESLKAQKTTIQNEVLVAHKKIADAAKTNDTLGMAINDIAEAFEKLRQEHASRLQAIDIAIAAGVASAKTEAQTAMQKLQSDLVVSPASVLQQNKDVMTKLEHAMMDGANAMQKVNNFDMGLRILEKKMENLAIQIKRVELQGQS